MSENTFLNIRLVCLYLDAELQRERSGLHSLLCAGLCANSPAALSLSPDCNIHNLAFLDPLVRELQITADDPWITEKIWYEYLHDSHS